MMRFPSVLFTVFIVLLSGCNRKNVTDAEFDQLRMLMSQAEVEKIIGAKPDEVKKLQPEPGINFTFCTWKNGDDTLLLVHFQNDQARKFEQIDLAKILEQAKAQKARSQ